jgi:hypothetical protein
VALRIKTVRAVLGGIEPGVVRRASLLSQGPQVCYAYGYSVDRDIQNQWLLLVVAFWLKDRAMGV